MENRGEKKAFNAIIEGEFRPLSISDDLKELFSIRAEELNVTDPYDAAADIIDQVKDQLENITLGGDLFPNIQNPLDTSLVQGISDVVANATLPNINTGFIGQGNVNLPNNLGLVYNENAPLAQKIDTIAKVDSLI